MFVCVNSLSISLHSPFYLYIVLWYDVYGMTNAKQFTVLLIDFIVGYFNINLSASIIIHRYFSYNSLYLQKHFISVGHHCYGFAEDNLEHILGNYYSMSTSMRVIYYKTNHVMIS